MAMLLRKIIKSILFLLVVDLVVILVWIIWEHGRDPLKAIDMGVVPLQVVEESVYNHDIIPQKRNYKDFLFNSEKTGDIRIYTSLPAITDNSVLPVMIILGGLHIGRENFSFIQEPGYNALIIYNYPYSPEYWYEGTALLEIPRIRSAVLKVPTQVLEIVKWLSRQPWVDTDRISVLGYSFGAIFTPAVYNLANHYNVKLGPGIICYGGADIENMLYTNLKKMSEPFRSITAYLASTAIYTIDPVNHLPQLHNDFLIINGTKDNQIPKESWQLLQKIIPEPRTIKILPDGHMHPDNPELTEKLVRLSKEWLVEKGAVNP